MELGKAETRQQLADWWDSFDTRYMRPYFSRPDVDSPTSTAPGASGLTAGNAYLVTLIGRDSQALGWNAFGSLILVPV